MRREVPRNASNVHREQDRVLVDQRRVHHILSVAFRRVERRDHHTRAAGREVNGAQRCGVQRRLARNEHAREVRDR